MIFALLEISSSALISNKDKIELSGFAKEES